MKNINSGKYGNVKRRIIILFQADEPFIDCALDDINQLNTDFVLLLNRYYMYHANFGECLHLWVLMCVCHANDFKMQEWEQSGID